MPPAVIAAGVVAAGAIGGAVLSSGAQKSAANAANQTQQAATQAQLKLGQQSLGLQRDVYNSNFGVLSPYAANGLVASNAMNALLGLPAAQPMTSPLTQPATPQPTPGAPSFGTGNTLIAGLTPGQLIPTVTNKILGTNMPIPQN
jgi:hypothetical protein